MLDVGVAVLWLVDRVSIKWERRSRDVSQPTWAVRVVACGIWGSVAEIKILEWWSRNSKDKYWFTFDITLKLRVKIVGIPPKKEWHWLWRSGIIWTSPLSALTLKWDVSAAKMSKLTLFLQKELKDIYSRHLAEKMNECVACLCYGCVHAKDSRVMHNLCSMHALDQVRFCISRFCRWSGDHGTVRERGRFGSIRMVWIQNTDVSPGKSGSMMSLTSYWRNGAPVLVVMTSRASSPYLNCVGW